MLNWMAPTTAKMSSPVRDGKLPNCRDHANGHDAEQHVTKEKSPRLLGVHSVLPLPSDLSAAASSAASCEAGFTGGSPASASVADAPDGGKEFG